MSGCKINPVSMGLSLGILWGISVFLMGLLAYHYSYGKPFVEMLATLYLGFSPTISGGLLGFIDAFITGFLVVWLYNCINSCSCCCKKEEKSEK